MTKLILASSSPRRIELFKKVGLDFDVIESNYQEDINLNLNYRDLAKFLAKGKVETVAKKVNKGIIVGADTFVVIDGEILGKPNTDNEAREMLCKISGKKLEVVTGFFVYSSESKESVSEIESTKLKIKNLTSNQIDNYIATGEPIGKAGAFAIQGLGCVLIEDMCGDFYNVMGLPISRLVDILTKFNIKVL